MKHFQTQASLDDLGAVKDAVTRLEIVLTDILLHGNELPLSDPHYHRLFDAAQSLESNTRTLINGVDDVIRLAPQFDARTEWQEMARDDKHLLQNSIPGELIDHTAPSQKPLHPPHPAGSIADATGGPGRHDNFEWNC